MIVIVAAVVVAMVVIFLANLHVLNLSLRTPYIAIYPLHPAPHVFDLDLKSIRCLNRHCRLGGPQFLPLHRFSGGLIFPPGSSIIPGSA